MKDVLNASFAIGAKVNMELHKPGAAIKTLMKKIDMSKEVNIVLDIATEKVMEFLVAVSLVFISCPMHMHAAALK